MYSCGHFFSDSELAEFSTAMLGVGKYLMVLRGLSLNEGTLMWQVLPKAHYMQHLELQGRVMNPRYTQNYCEESFVGRFTSIWKATAVGKYSRTIQHVVLIRYLVAFVLRLEL